MSDSDHDRDGHHHGTEGHSRRKVLECMTWAGTGVLWTIAGGVPYSLGMIGQAMAKDTGALTFMQISNSHMGFHKPANRNVAGTLEEAIGRIKAMPVRPSFLIHTGDITHLSQASEFDDAEKIVSQAGLDVHYLPGEHDVLDPEVTLYNERHGRGTKGAGWYSFDTNGVHFIGLINVGSGGRFMGRVSIDNPGGKAGGLGVIGDEQLAWMQDDLKGRSGSTPILVWRTSRCGRFIRPWGWGTEDGLRALSLRSVTVLNGHIHQVLQKVEGNVTFHTAASTAYPQPAPGTAPAPGPKKVPPGKLRTMLGIRTVTFKQGEQRLGVVDAPLG
jgi:3',5'-cyclic AMP phosphodiesterase CpdA